MEEPRQFDTSDLETAVRDAMAQGPIRAGARVERAIVAACPAMKGGWAAAYVGKLVAAGDLAEHEVAAAIGEVRDAMRPQSRAGINNPAAYASAILKRHLARKGIPWGPRQRQSG